jgi:adenosylcobyric acid synthase
VWQDLSAKAYYEHFEWLSAQALESFERLAAQFEFIVIEGAGSVAEVNLNCRDLVNFGFARRVGAPSMLVGDIDRGGIFASITGTMHLLDEGDRQLVRSFAVNRFRGDPTLFFDGVAFLEHKTDRPCLGVFPFAPDISLPAEDGVSLDDENGISEVAVVRLPRISNFTDFDRLQVRWIEGPDRTLYSHVILPGTKNTTGDLEWLRSRGLDAWIRRQYAAGAVVIGICGGYQMLGERIEENGRAYEGLGLLPVSTVMQPEKTVRRVHAHTPAGAKFGAYEIHMGQTSGECNPFAFIEDKPEGARANRCIGTYLHGALEDEQVCIELDLNRARKQVAEDPYDQLAAWFETNADTRLFEELYL